MAKNESLVKINSSKKAKALAFPEQAKALVVTNEKELIAVDQFVAGGKALMKEIREGYDDIISDAHGTWKGAIAKRDHYLNPVAEGVKIAKGKMAPYMEEQRRKQREAEEAKRRAEREAEEAEIKAEEERQRLAREALQDGEKEKAEKILSKPAPEIVAETIDVPTVTKLETSHAVVTWDWKATDFSLVPEDLKMLDRVAINKIVREKKGDTKIPGIMVFETTGVSSKG